MLIMAEKTPSLITPHTYDYFVIHVKNLIVINSLGLAKF